MFSTCLVQGLYGEQQTVQSRQSCSSDILACIKTDKGICAFKLGSDPTSQIWTSFAERERERERANSKQKSVFKTIGLLESYKMHDLLALQKHQIC